MSILNSIFRITITNPGPNVVPSEGFIDEKTIPLYAATEGFPSTSAISLAKSRANVRYRWMIQELLKLGGMTTTQKQFVGANKSTEPTEIILDVEVYNPEILSTNDELNPNVTLTGMDAIKRAIARSMIRTNSEQIEWYPIDQTLGILRYNSRIEKVDVGPITTTLLLAEAEITVEFLTYSKK